MGSGKDGSHRSRSPTPFPFPSKEKNSLLYLLFLFSILDPDIDFFLTTYKMYKKHIQGETEVYGYSSTDTHFYEIQLNF